MNTKTFSNDTIYVILLMGAGAVGLYIGFETLSRYPNAVQGTLGLATLYLIYLLYFPPKNFVRKPVGTRVEFPRDIKYIIFNFFLYTIITWSAQYLGNAVLGFLRTFMHN